MRQKFTTQDPIKRNRFLSSFDFIEQREGHYYVDENNGLLRFYEGDFYAEELVDLNLDDRIDKFRGDYHFLSNFFHCQFAWDGFIFTSSESAYQSAKATTSEIKEEISNLGPKEAKERGRSIELRGDWNNVKREFMLEIVENKFRQNPILGEELLKTENNRLVEENDWGDTYWGRVNGEGCNYLGKTLMRVRRMLQKEKEQ